MLKTTRVSFYLLNFLNPLKSDFRNKRTELFYPDYSVPCVSRNTKTEYTVEYRNKFNEKDK